jgi:general secretion pathway protein M
MKQWFNQLAPREQLFVTVAGILGVFTLIITLAVRPIINSTTTGHERIEAKRELLSELERVAERIGPQNIKGEASSGTGNQSLVVVVDRSTRDHGLAPYLKRNQPDGTSSIRLRLENAPFDAVIEWLSAVRDQHGLRTTSANIDKASAEGRINCNLTLSRGGS